VTGKQLRKIRELSGLSQEKFGEKIGVHAQTIGHWETEKYPIDKIYANRIIDFFHSQLQFTPRQIKSIREKLELSQRAFADILDVSQTTIKSWEIGEHKPKRKKAELLLELKNNSNTFYEIDEETEMVLKEETNFLENIRNVFLGRV
jgi:putative transcriptional regulator